MTFCQLNCWLLQTSLALWTIQLPLQKSLQNYICNDTSTCEDLTLNFPDPSQAYMLTCDGNQACFNTIVVVSSSSDLSFDFTLHCIQPFACEDTVLRSERQTNVYCGSLGDKDFGSCKDLKMHLSAPKISTNVIYSLGDTSSLRNTDFFCSGDKTASCAMVFNGASQFN